MGIPSYQSHLRRKYAKNQHLWLLPSLPNDHDCVNLYVDLNGIVHTCAYRLYHRHERELIQTHTDMSYIELEAQVTRNNADNSVTESLYPKLFSMVMEDIQQLLYSAQPTKLVYLALDGVAPRAKMVQQRQRRFRSVQDKGLERAVYHKHKRAYIRGELWDSNCVTPGTTFMAALATYLHSHIHELKSPCASEHFQVVLSDATEHGEGEHKIMEHLREAGDPNVPSNGRSCSSSNGRTGTHVLYGQDADLVMLGFAYRTMCPHAPFYLLRERDAAQMPAGSDAYKRKHLRSSVRNSSTSDPPVPATNNIKEHVSGNVGNVQMETNREEDNDEGKGDTPPEDTDIQEDSHTRTLDGHDTSSACLTDNSANKSNNINLDTATPTATRTVGDGAGDASATTSMRIHHQFLRVDVLQSQIIRHMESYGDLYPVDEHRNAIRDYVAMCYLLGNDFLPHSPSLAIQDKGIDMLFEVYVPLRKTLGRYLTHEHYVPLEDEIVGAAGTEPTRSETHFDHEFLTQLIQKLAQQEDYLAGRIHSQTLQKRKWALQQQRYPTDQSCIQPTGFHATVDGKNVNGNKKRYLHPNAQQHTFEHDMKHLQTLPPGFWAMDDKVMAGTPGWKGRYYTEVERVRNMQDVHEMCHTYMQGMFWTLQYYFHGCWSTSWHYPYLSAPLFSNMAHYLEQPRTNVNRLVKRVPEWSCTALEQLRLVLPGGSLKRWCSNCDGVIVDDTAKECDGGGYRLVPFAKRFRWECGVRLGFPCN